MQLCEVTLGRRHDYDSVWKKIMDFNATALYKIMLEISERVSLDDITV